MQTTTTVRPLVAVDWSSHGIHVTYDGYTVHRLPDAEALLERLTEPHTVVTESTFESWDHTRREQVAARFRAAGHEILVYRPTHTARMRARDGVEKSDEADARCIHRIATEGRLHLYPLPAPDPDWQARRETVNATYTRIRLQGRKIELVAAAKEALGPYADLDPDARAVLGNGKAYLGSIVAATFFAAVNSRSRDEFERLLGLHGSAYPSVLRAEVHHHGYRHAHAHRDVTWQQFRRELRRARTRILGSLTAHPELAAAARVPATDAAATS